MPDHGEVGLSLWMKDKGHGNRVLRGKHEQITHQWDRAPRAHDPVASDCGPHAREHRLTTLTCPLVGVNTAASEAMDGI
jgi:hypothetical protein